MSLYFIEYTDTYGGEANYSWVRRLYVKASSETGAIRKARKYWGHTARIRKDWHTGDCTRYNVQGQSVCYFVNWIDSPDDVGYECEVI